MTSHPDQDTALADLDRTRQELADARTAHFANIRRALAIGLTPSAIGRAAGYTREYIAKIRDGKGPAK